MKRLEKSSIDNEIQNPTVNTLISINITFMITINIQQCHNHQIPSEIHKSPSPELFAS
jgi:hypothetical protein